MKNIQIIYPLVFLLAILFSCKEETVMYSSEADFSSIQIQKFDYGSSSGRGQIYQGTYSPNRDTIYFNIPYFPDQDAPTYTDWQIQSALPSGARVVPGLSGIMDLSESKEITVYAPDGTTAQYVLALRIFEVPFAELDKGFGRYSQLFELTKEQLGGWSDASQRACVVIGDYLVVSNMDKPFLVYDKRTGSRINKTIPMPAGETFNEIFADEDGTLLATTASIFSASYRPNLKIYRWTNGIDAGPELFYELPLGEIPLKGSHGIGFKASVWGSTQQNAQIMLDVDGRGSDDDRAVRIAVENGVPSPTIDIFNTGVATKWNGTAVPMSKTQRTPYVAATLGFPPKMNYVGDNGIKTFETNPANSNFLNKIIGNASYFEFNHSKYLTVSTISWPGTIRMLIFCLDDPALIDAGKDQPEKYKLLNPFMEEATFTSAADASSIAVQVQPDGKTALVYFLGMDTGIVAYELTIIGTSSN